MIKNIFNKNSILFTITIAFILSILVIVVSFITLYKNIEQKDNHIMKKRAMDVSRMVIRECRINNHYDRYKLYKKHDDEDEENHYKLDDDFVEHLDELNFKLIEQNKMQSILQNKNLIIKKEKRLRMNHITFLSLDGEKIIYIKTPRDEFMLIDNQQINSPKLLLITIFITILIAFIILYIFTIKKLEPLQSLQQKVKNLANEDFEVDCATDKKDEISLLANEFHKSATKLKEIKESRNIFIRNIMHELKTPITKGKLLTELDNTQDNKQKMQMVFFRLESLIQEFATIEELISTKKELIKKEYFLEDIIDTSCDLLMCEEHSFNRAYTNIKLNVDFNLFTIAIKNLLDNGIKYSKQKTITIKNEDDKLIFENQGEQLAYPLEKYFEPFFKGDDVKSNQSFGLGLYIVHHILKAHGMKLGYRYEDGRNIFSIA
jgi:two-component system OmpR family sensor kinase